MLRTKRRPIRGQILQWLEDEGEEEAGEQGEVVGSVVLTHPPRGNLQQCLRRWGAEDGDEGERGAVADAVVVDVVVVGGK